MTKESSNPRNMTIIGNPVYNDLRGGSPAPPPPPTGPPPPPPPHAAAPFEAGQRVANRYLIQEQIGSGGMGIVYRALEEAIEREVAMKFIVTDNTLPQEEQKAHDDRFRREAQALGALPPHPNRVVLYHYGHDDESGLNFIAMELVRGVAFSSVLEREDLTVQQILTYAEQLVMALEDVHASKLIHRDLKPENLILTRSLLGDEQLKLIDFGIAQGHRLDAQPDQREEQLIGTARYMAPELFLEGGDDDPRVDIYAIGVLLYEMVTGRGPFDHLIQDEGDLREVIRHHLESEPAPLTSRDTLGDLPNGLPGLILKCLARQPEDRFLHASELIQGLRRLKHPRAAQAVAQPEQPERLVQAHVWPIPQEEGVPILATSINGQVGLVAAFDGDGAVWLWDIHSGNMVRSLTDLEQEHLPEGQARLAFSPNGGLLAVGGRDGSLWIHDVEAYTTWPLKVSQGQHPVALTFDQSDALLVLSTTAGDLELWDVRERKRLARFAMGGEQSGPTQIRSLAFSPDRRSLVAGTELGLLFLWHFSDRSLSGALKAPPFTEWPAEGVTNPLSVLYQDISRDGAFLAVLRAGGVVEIWDPTTKERLGVVELPSDERPRRLAFSPDSRQLLVAYDSGTIVLVDAPSLAVLDEVRVPRCEAVNVSYTEDAVPLASIARGAAVQVWDLLRMGRLQTLGPFSDHLLDVTVTPRGDRAFTLSTSGHIDTWDLLSGRHLGRQPSGGATVRRLDKAPEPGRVLLCGAQEGLMALEGLDRNNLTPLTQVPLPVPAPEAGHEVQTYAISDDQRMVALGDINGNVRIYGYREPSDPEILPGSGVPVTAIAFSPNNQLLAVASADGRLCLWDLASAQIEWEDASESLPIHFIAFTPSGRLLSVPRGNDIAIWNLEHKRCVARLKGHTGPIRTMVHGLDGRLLLSSSDDRTARLWDLAQQRPLRILDDHPGPVTAATLGPNLRLLLTTSGPFLSIWRVLDAKLLARCVHLGEEAPGSSLWAAFTPEGFHITSHDELPILGVSRPNSRLPLRGDERQRLLDPRSIALQLITA